ncbi:hypothetical protein [Kitasatospora sp. NPDC001095]
MAATGATRGERHFPGGKDQLVATALTQAGQEVQALLTGPASEGADTATLAERPLPSRDAPTFKDDLPSVSQAGRR